VVRRKKEHKKSLQGKLTGRDHSVEPGVDGRAILEWILGRQGGKMWTGHIRLRTGTSGRPPQKAVNFMTR
jgi:hypothetical protein